MAQSRFGPSNILLLCVVIVTIAGSAFATADTVSLKKQAVDGDRSQYRALAIFNLLRLPAFGNAERIQFLTDVASSEAEPVVLRQVISGLEALPPEAALDPLFHLLDTAADAGIRERAMEALFHFHAEVRARNRLIDILLHDPDPALRAGVCLWLGVIQDPRVFEALAQACRIENDSSVRAAIIKGIALQPGADAEALLAELAARESDDTLRQLAAVRLAQRRSSEVAK